jgi:hypothetical protein
LAHDLIERYLFNLWPLLLPVTIVGLRRIFLVVGTIASKLARRFGIGTEPLLLDALVAFFLNAQSAVNLHSISPVFFGTWSHVGVYIVVVGCFLIAYQILEIHGKVRNHM